MTGQICIADPSEFAHRVADAYKHLYDLVHLRTHPLTDLLIPDPTLSRKDKAWRLHRILIEVIKELDPGPHAPISFVHKYWQLYGSH